MQRKDRLGKQGKADLHEHEPYQQVEKETDYSKRQREALREIHESVLTRIQLCRENAVKQRFVMPKTSYRIDRRAKCNF